MSKRTIPLIVGSLLIFGMVGYVFIHRSSPGDLTRAHAAVAGSPFIMDCKKCHAAEGMNVGCLKCHTEIQDQLKKHQGYHDYLAKAKKTECSKCHSEHNGADFPLLNKVSWEGKDPKTFNHPHVVYHLIDAHTKLTCEKCHAAKGRPLYSLPQFPKSRREVTYLGLQQDCMSCHADPHAGGKAWNCTSCHDQKHWKPAPYFNHDKYYPLRGAHRTISCGQCHAAPTSSNTRSAVGFGPTKGKRCMDCHVSPHRTKWKETCEACHQDLDKTWKDAGGRMTRLEHAETIFPLVVPHQKAKCMDCHAAKQAKAPYESRYPNPQATGYNRHPKDCEGCHQDEHKGQFVQKYPKCFVCHLLQGWKPTKFDRKMHQATSYPLVGAHLNADCNACHIKNSALKRRLYTETPTQCTACHKDIHYGQFRKNGETTCEDCHRSPVKWTLLIFNHETQSKFKLGEAHRKLACKECHPVVTLQNGIRLVQYKPIKSQCADCHGLEIPEDK